LSPLFLASYFFGFSLAGQYKIIEQIISFFRTLIQVYLKFFFPKLCFKVTHSLTEAVLFWKKYRLLLLSGVVPVLVVFYFFTEYIIQYFNVSLENNLELITVLRISLLIPILMVFSLSFEQLMFTFNKNKRYIQITIFVTTSNILLLLILAPILNLYGMIFSLIISEILFIILYSRNLNIFQKRDKLDSL
jgi:O-antigen/teichoic acid export membrane protein